MIYVILLVLVIEVGFFLGANTIVCGTFYNIINNNIILSGTHGHMKCAFDGQLKSQDTVLLNLYKRIFPKWNYENCIVTDRDGKQSDIAME